MSDLEVARRTAFLLSNPLRKTERVDVRRLRCFSCPLWAINLCVVPTLTFENVCLRENCTCAFAAPPPAPSVLPASSVPSRVVVVALPLLQ